MLASWAMAAAGRARRASVERIAGGCAGCGAEMSVVMDGCYPVLLQNANTSLKSTRPFGNSDPYSACLRLE